MASCPDVLASPAGSPERQAAIDCQKGRVAKKLTKKKVKGSMVKSPAPPQGVDASNPFKAAADSLKGESWRT